MIQENIYQEKKHVPNTFGVVAATLKREEKKIWKAKILKDQLSENGHWGWVNVLHIDYSGNQDTQKEELRLLEKEPST